MLILDEHSAREAAAYRDALKQHPEIEPVTFTDADAALGWLREHPVEAVVIDVARPDSDGVAFVAAVRELRDLGDPYIVMLIGAPDAALEVRARDAGLDELFVKPVRREAFGALVEHAAKLREGEEAEEQEALATLAPPEPAPKRRLLVPFLVLGAIAVLLVALLAWRSHPWWPGASPQARGTPHPRVHAGSPPTPRPAGATVSRPAGGGAGEAVGPGGAKLPGAVPPVSAGGPAPGPGMPAHAGATALPGGGGSAASTAGAAVAAAGNSGAGHSAAPASQAAGSAAAPRRSGTGAANAPANGASGSAGLSPPQARGVAAALAPLALPGSGFLVLDAGGRDVAGHDAGVPRVPASTVKLLTAAAALAILGPDYRFATVVEALGPLRGPTLAGPLALIGSGDPALTSAELDAAAAKLAQRGIRDVTGGLVVDATAFSLPERNSHWPQGDLRYPYAAGVGALALDGGLRDGAPVDDLQRYAGAVFRARLAAHGVGVVGATRYGPAGAGTVLWTRHSPALAALMGPMLASSDNHVAEQVLRAIGHSAAGEGSERAGVAAVRAYLVRLRVPVAGLALYDGSGLSPDDRASPRTLATALYAVAARPEGRVLLAALPLVGRDLDVSDHHLRAAAGSVVAKAGHLANARALAGYLKTARHGNLAFAFLAGGAADGNAGLRASQDAALDAIARAVP